MNDDVMIRERFMRAASDDEQLAAALLAKGLMTGDAATFQAGYSRENALIAALELVPDADEDRVRRLLRVIQPPAPEELLADQQETMGREHAAWLDIGQEFKNRQIDINEGGWASLIYAIRKWGEELHQLRLANPSHDEKALREAREAYEGQWERLTYPEPIE